MLLGSKDLYLSYQYLQVPWGLILVAGNENGLAALYPSNLLSKQCKVKLLCMLKASFPHYQLAHTALPASCGTESLRTIFSALSKDSWSELANLPYQLIGSDFQVKVWRSIASVNWGDTVSYSDVAKQLHQPNAVRAVANAIARNHLSILIPCHRVISKSGQLSGYRWGVDLKRQLLAQELRE